MVSTITLFSNPDLIQVFYDGENFILNMAKGYWLSTGFIKDAQGMQPFLKAIHDWLPSLMENFLPEIWQL